jgi:hypothetical protein
MIFGFPMNRRGKIVLQVLPENSEGSMGQGCSRWRWCATLDIVNFVFGCLMFDSSLM